MAGHSNAGRYRIGGHIIELRAPRLADAESWRRTTLENESRLRPAFGSPDGDWDEEHSPAAWAAIWWRSIHDPDVRIARVLTVANGAQDTVVGYQVWAGQDPRTGHAEASVWVAGLPNSYEVTAFFTAACVLDMLNAHPDLPYVIAPMAVHNRPPIALAETVGFPHLQTLRQLREYDGRAADHSIHYLSNTEASRAGLAAIISTIGAEPLAPRPADRVSRAAALGLIRHKVRRLRTRARTLRATPTTPACVIGPTRTEHGHEVRFHYRGHEYSVTFDGRPVGDVGVHIDHGSSTTAIIDRLHPHIDSETASAVLAVACREAAENQATRRLTVALAERHSPAVAALLDLGFVSEGVTLPSLGDRATPRESWTRLHHPTAKAPKPS